MEHLRRQGFEAFCPHLRKVRSHARKREQILAPLFPGYAFVRLDAGHRPWRSINGTRGVKHLLGGDGGSPRPMPEAAMDSILARCVDGIVEQVADRPKAGQPIRVVAGPFADSLGSVELLDERGRVSVLLDILGRETRVRMSIEGLAPA